uniref:CSON011822 protein n=1 Tax=Culicoides sonorensis TaxID=179676 RepID=A0A336LZB8_CULSO
MDDFALRMLEKAEKRSKELGLSAPSPRLPLSEARTNSENGNESNGDKVVSLKKANTDTYLHNSPRSTTKVTRQYSATENGGSKENDVEINITAPSNVQVEVEVSECDIDEHGNEIPGKMLTETSSETSSDVKITAPRDTPRGHLQRLGALYADKDISSPIHRNEDRFHEGFSETSKPKTKFTRLAALASEINSWEDDPSHPDYKHHRKTIYSNGNEASPRKDNGAVKKGPAPLPPTAATASPKKPLISPKKPMVSPRRVITDLSSQNEKQQKENEATRAGPSTKNLQWDSKVMSQLESQGFKRRDTTHQRLEFNFKDYKGNRKNQEEVKKAQAPDVPDTKVSTSHIEGRDMPKERPKTVSVPSSSKGIVQGRTAMFDKPKRKSFMGKDPTELSLKERMAIFEKNKGSAPIPKAPITLAAPLKSTKSAPIKSVQTRVEINRTNKINEEEDENEAPKPAALQQCNSSIEPREMKGLGLGVLSTVANLMSKGPTISESKIANETRKQREEEMDLLMNRYKYKESSSERKNSVPKAPPLPPAGYLSSPGSSLHKRRSSGDAIDQISPEVKSTLDDVKRIRVAPPKEGRLYPALSDIESANTESDLEQYATASVSASDEGEHLFQPASDNYQRLSQQQLQRQQEKEKRKSEMYDEDDDRYDKLIDLFLFCFCAN